jgi:hypothetical protein
MYLSLEALEITFTKMRVNYSSPMYSNKIIFVKCMCAIDNRYANASAHRPQKGPISYVITIG